MKLVTLITALTLIFSSQSFANVVGKSLYCKYSFHAENYHIGLHFLDENIVEVFYIKGTDVLKTDTTYLEKGLDTIEIKDNFYNPHGSINRKSLSMYVSFLDYHPTGHYYDCFIKNKNGKFLTRKGVVSQLYFVIKNSGNQF